MTCTCDTNKFQASSDNTAQLPIRIQRLKDAYLKVKPSITIGRALAYTEVTKEHPDLPNNIRRAKGFKRACETAPMLIQDGELIIGHPCGKPRAGAFSPDTAWKWIRDELDTISTRAQDPYEISEEDKKIMREELFPFWEGRSIDEACEKLFRKEGIWEFSAEACVSDLTYHHTSGGGDTSPGYDIILFSKGINGVRAEAKAHLDALAERADLSAEEIEKKHHYEAAIETCDGILIYANRLSDYAKELAKKEQDPARKLELEKIAEVNATVPANPPKTFHEALQAIWTIQSLFLLEENQCSTSLGRFDQYVYPCFATDMDSGQLTESEAFELMSCFILKCSEVIWYTPSATAQYFAGYMPFINLCVGGVKRHGGDGTNDLTYLVMDAIGKVGMYQPSLACRIHNQSPRKYLQKVVEVVKSGNGMPACHFDDAHIKMMLRKGFDYEDARDYCLMGCVEPQKSGRVHQWTAGGFTQWPIAIEFVLNQGVLQSYGGKVGLDTGDISHFETYENFDAAVKKQIAHILDVTAKGTIINQKLVRDTMPTPYMSLFVDGCMQSGKDVTAGGAVLYSGPGTIFAGLGTYVDSMAAIKKLVFDDKKYTLPELKKALDANWQGYEQVQRDCLNAPKYGNNLDYADLIAADIIDFTEKTSNQHKTLYAHLIHGTLSQSFNTPLGEMIAATPDGRISNSPLSDGMSPSQGADKNGPTAIINSVAKLNVESMSLGMSHNFKFLKGTLETPEAEAGLISLLQASSIFGNAQMQFNYLDNEALIQAQKHPEDYRNLIVRVAGYCAFFVELCKEVQDEIISRSTLDS
ncbi:choline trimethylamine-lyase [Halodesulfovibrio sp.]|jgi:formate C-acetyltransferase|uniref:choline trimethylamine-lyase n=1 Tax=Halodesulfovibrio sp. TaxID=1912772 RepID=UPI0025FA1549|nr:choline trimethylamine-lyase [Halodesulfovibrio sp.]MCT4534779.1 choline trimethylamine-lyase [Halodesulfovibrio sp.]